MNKIFNIEFEYRPVGQGLFYTGIFNHQPSSAKYTMAYDCGVKPVNNYITTQINSFGRNFRREEKLDLLVISHFHEDHYSHIEDLLNETNGARTVILPFLSQDEMLLAYSQNLANDGSPTSGRFISNPITFLKDLRVDEIIYIHSSEGLDESPPLEGKEGVNESDNFEFNLTNNLTELDDLPDGVEREEDVRHCINTGNLNLNFIWEFKFFNKVRDPNQVDAFKAEVNQLLSVNSATISNVTTYFTNNPLNAKQIFRNLYERYFLKRHLNDTSLVLFHAPANNIGFDFVKSRILGRPYFPYRCESEGRSARRCGNLMTGDIKIDNTCLNQITVKWSNAIREGVVYAQIPHHGASGYFIDRFFNEFSKASQFIINFGLGNINKHPRQDIINMITNRFPQSRIQLNTQVNHVKIRYDIGNYN